MHRFGFSIVLSLLTISLGCARQTVPQNADVVANPPENAAPTYQGVPSDQGMVAIYDRTGKVVGWLQADNIIGLDGGQRAFLSKGLVVSYQGVHLGTYEKAFFGMIKEPLSDL